MLFQTIQIDVKKVRFDADINCTIYALARNQQAPFANVEIQVNEKISPDIELIAPVSQELLGLNILPFDLHADRGYANFSKELLKGFLCGHHRKVEEFTVYVSQQGLDFGHSGTESLIERNFRKGDQVIMFGSHEATLPEYSDKIWTCLNDSFKDKAGMECVHLDSFSGAYFCKYLTLVKH